MGRFVVLRHDEPDGSWHYDWLLEPAAPAPDPERPLVCFRTRRVPTECDTFEAERIGDHRSVYLDYEGPISGGRGEVRRIVAGEARVSELTDQRALIGLLARQPRMLEGRSDDGRLWLFATIGVGGTLASRADFC